MCPQWLVIVPKPGPDPLLRPSSFSETPAVTKDEHATNTDPPSCTSYTAENKGSCPPWETPALSEERDQTRCRELCGSHHSGSGHAILCLYPETCYAFVSMASCAQEKPCHLQITSSQRL